MKTIRVGPISSVTETSLTGKRFRKPIRLLVSFPLGWCSAAKPVTCLLYASNISAREINGPLEKSVIATRSNSLHALTCSHRQSGGTSMNPRSSSIHSLPPKQQHCSRATFAFSRGLQFCSNVQSLDIGATFTQNAV